MEAVGCAAIKQVGELILDFLKEHLGYMISSNKHVKDMREQMTELNDLKRAVEQHKNQNTERCLEVPINVITWLEEVRVTNERVENVATDVGTCFPLYRHKLGVKALEIIKKIKSVKEKQSLILWNDHPIPLGRVDTMMASISTPSSDHHMDFSSRAHIFTEALKALGSDNASEMIALCGMGGVGKTTITEELRKIVAGRKMFDYIVKVVIGEKSDPIAIQQTIANYLGIELKGSTKSENVDKLRMLLKAKADAGMKTLLVIMDDVWHSVDLEDIGLSPPIQGVHFKVLLTSRLDNVCSEMGVEANNVLKVDILEEEEAQSFFFRQVSKTCVDTQLQKIGKDIIKKCKGLPIAIKTMACSLRGKLKDTWKNALLRLEHHDNDDVVKRVFQMSYDNLQDAETKSVFLMCGLYPEDFDIPKEDLVRYGWGLNTFKYMSTITEARSSLNTCIEQLTNANLLLKSDASGCVKMHDLVLAFVLNMFSEEEHASIVRHGGMSGWPETHISGSSCKSISLTCRGISEFPTDIMFPNLLILKLMYGDKTLKFPQDFYGKMKSLQVISYDNMSFSLLQTSPQCCTNLRVLNLHECSMKFDCSFIENLLNLEVLSFANSEIERLPSTIGNLKKLRLLDLKNCHGLSVDNGVLKNLVKLEEINATVDHRYSFHRDSVSFTYDDWNEMAKRSKNLLALEFVFFEDNAPLKDMSFENLERFKISVGRSEIRSCNKCKHLFQSTLDLVISKDGISQTRIGELFKKTEELCLSVDGINKVEDIVVKPSHPFRFSSFYNLRNLVVWKCADLKYIFTLGVAKALSTLEHLQVYECDNMKALIHTKGGGEETIRFPKLKSLYLERLPELSCLRDDVNILELPQLTSVNLKCLTKVTRIFSREKMDKSSFFGEEARIPKLEVLHIERMENLEEVWPCDFRVREEVKLRRIIVSYCDKLVNLFPSNAMPLLHHLEELQIENCGTIKVLFNMDLNYLDKTGVGCSSSIRNVKVSYCRSLVNLFPCNPMPLLHHLEELHLRNCASIEELFEIDLDSLGETGEGSNNNLRLIEVKKLWNLRQVWRIKGESNSCFLIPSFPAVERIKIENCMRFRHLWTPTSISFDLGALLILVIIQDRSKKYYDEMEVDDIVKSSEEEEIDIISKKEASQVIDIKTNIAFPPFLTHSFHNLRTLVLEEYDALEVVFEIESPTSRELTTTHHNQQRLLPCLKNLYICSMHKMSHVWKCDWNKFLILQKQPSESPLHNLTTIELVRCWSIKYLFSPLMAKLLSNLRKVKMDWCSQIEEVVSNRDDEVEENTKFTSTSTHTSTTLFPHLDSLTLDNLHNLKCIGGGGAKDGTNELSFNDTTTSTRLDQFKFPQVGGVSWSLGQYAREINISSCSELSSVIPCYEAEQRQKLQVLSIKSCYRMKDIFETQLMNSNNNNNTTSDFDEGNSGTPGIPRLNNVIMLPNLKILYISRCDRLEHIFTFSTLESLRKLEELTIRYCDGMKVIVKEEDDKEQTSSKEVVVFPRLKSIQLEDLPELEGFFLGDNEFLWPSLDKVTIKECPKMTVFAPGGSTTPLLKYVRWGVGKYNVEECGLNTHLTTPAPNQTPFPSSCLDTLEGMPLSSQNLIELHVYNNNFCEKIFTSSELLQLQKLEKIDVFRCSLAQEVFEALEGGTNSSGFDDSQTTLLKLPNLTQVDLSSLDRLRHIWKSNQWTTFEFPNLTTVTLYQCGSLEHVFTSSMAGSLLQLQELHIRKCNQLEGVFGKDTNVAVEEEEKEFDGIMNEIIMFPRLKSLTLEWLSCLKGFCMGKEDFSFPLLDTLEIRYCSAITTFTHGNSATPELKEIKTCLKSVYAAGEDINSIIKISQEVFRRTI